MIKYSKIELAELDVCEIKNNEMNNLRRDDFEQVAHLIGTETVLSKRIPDKDFTDIINLLRFTITNVTVTEIENALVSYSLSQLL